MYPEFISRNNKESMLQYRDIYKKIRTIMSINSVTKQREGGQWAVFYTSPQSFIITFSYSLANNFGDFSEFLLVDSLNKCSIVSRTIYNLQER